MMGSDRTLFSVFFKEPSGRAKNYFKKLKKYENVFFLITENPRKKIELFGPRRLKKRMVNFQIRISTLITGIEINNLDTYSNIYFQVGYSSDHSKIG